MAAIPAERSTISILAPHHPLRSRLRHRTDLRPGVASRWPQTYPPQTSAAYLHLPHLDPRVSAARGTNHELRPTMITTRRPPIENHLRTRFGYTLQLPRTACKGSHCEFSFRAQTGTLRILRILDGGHVAHAGNSLARGQRIPHRRIQRPDRKLRGPRQRRALPGWKPISPATAGRPSIPLPRATAARPRAGVALALYIDAMSSFWRDWIVSYDTSHQYILGQAAVQRYPRSVENARNWARDHYASMLKWARRSQDRVEHSPERWAVIGRGPRGSLFFFGKSATGRAPACTKSGCSAHPERSPEQAAAMWYRAHGSCLGTTRNGKTRVADRPGICARRSKTLACASLSHALPQSMNPPASETPPMTHSVCRSYTRK